MDQSSEAISTWKHIVQCGKAITDDTPTTQGWLDNLTFLKTTPLAKSQQMSHKKLLEGILQKHKSVVVKIADKSENIKIEYDTYERLFAADVKGIVHYFCYFECNDDIKRIGDYTPHVCKGTGNTMRLLIMERIPNKSFQEHEWHEKDKDVIKSCIKQVICTALDAFLKTGFVHGDLHCNNILIKRTTVKTIEYSFGSVSVVKYKTRLMDFEFSKFDQDVAQFFKHLKLVFVSSLMRQFGGLPFINSNTVDRLSILTGRLWETSTDAKDVLSLLSVVDDM